VADAESSESFVFPKLLPDLGPFSLQLQERIYVYDFPRVQNEYEFNAIAGDTEKFVAARGQIFTVKGGRVWPNPEENGGLVSSLKGVNLIYSGERRGERKVKVEKGKDNGFSGALALIGGQLVELNGELVLNPDDGELVVAPLPGKGIVVSTTEELKKERNFELLQREFAKTNEYFQKYPYNPVVA
jgi:hypothetical protein